MTEETDDSVLEEEKLLKIQELKNQINELKSKLM